MAPAVIATFFSEPSSLQLPLEANKSAEGVVAIYIQRVEPVAATADLEVDFFSLLDPTQLVSRDRQPIFHQVSPVPGGTPSQAPIKPKQPRAGSAIPVPSQAPRFVLDKAYANAQAELHFFNFGASNVGPHFDTAVPIPLAAFGDTNSPAFVSKTLSPFNLEIANPTHFPEDDYHIGFNVMVQLPAGILLQQGEAFSSVIPVADTVIVGPAASQFVITAVHPTGNESRTPNAGYEIALSRKLPLQLFLWGLTLSPLILTVVLAWRLLTATIQGEAISGWVTGLAILALTVVPFRAVLVPNDLPNLTLVDLTLGLTLLLLAALVLRVLRFPVVEAAEKPANGSAALPRELERPLASRRGQHHDRPRP